MAVAQIRVGGNRDVMSTEDVEGTPVEGEEPTEVTPEADVVPTTTGSTPAAAAAAASRRDAVREKAVQVSAQQKRNRRIWRTVGVIAVIAVIAAAAIVVTNIVLGAANRAQGDPKNFTDGGFTVSEAMLTASTSAGNGTLTTPGATDAPAEPSATETASTINVDIYFDFHEPAAASFQQANAKQLAQWVNDDLMTVTYHPVATVTGKSNGTKFSARAVSALGCVGTYSSNNLFAFTHELLAQQPEAETEGLTDSELADLAIAIGAEDPKKLRACIEDAKYMSWAKKITDAATAGPLAGTDVTLDDSFVVLINGVEYVGSVDNPAEFAQAVLKASTESPSPTPTPTESTDPTETPTEETPEPTSTDPTLAPIESGEPAPGT